MASSSHRQQAMPSWHNRSQGSYRVRVWDDIVGSGTGTDGGGWRCGMRGLSPGCRHPSTFTHMRDCAADCVATHLEGSDCVQIDFECICSEPRICSGLRDGNPLRIMQ